MTPVEYALLAFVSLFVIIDPVSIVPAFLAMTPDNTAKERARMAGVACVLTFLVLMAFALFGQYIFKFLGITLPAFQIAGGILLLFVALDMLQARRSAVIETPAERREGARAEDIGVTPLGIPMLAGPGAITTVILLQEQAVGISGKLSLYGCIFFVCALSFVILGVSASGIRWISPLVMKVLNRLMGLLLAAISIQFMLSGVGAAFPGIVR